MTGQKHLSGADILTDLTHMLPGSCGLVDNCLARGKDDFLHHNHGIPFLGQGVTGVHHRVLLRSERDRGSIACAERVCRGDGDAVHGTGGIVGRTDVGVHRPGGYPSSGRLNRNGFRPRGKALFLQQGQVLGSGLVQRPVVEILKSHALFLPQ